MQEQNLESILKNIDIETLEELESFIIQSPEYMKLFRCTQMRDDVLRTNDDDSANRGLHTVQVAENAGKLAEELLKGKSEVTKLSEEEQKQVLIAKIVGLSHDLGHTPMGHATEAVFGKKIDGKFGHDEYSGVVFSKLFEKFITRQDKLTGEFAFDEKQQEELRESPLKDYIINGVQNHGKYMSTWARGDSRVDLPLICGRLADTLSFMPADLMDLSTVERAKKTRVEGKILTEEMMLNLVKNGITTHVGSLESELPTEQITAITPIGKFFEENSPDFNYKQIISDLVSGDKDKLQIIQTQILREVAQANLTHIGDKDNPIVSISDNLKLLRDAEINTRGNQDKSFNEMEKGIPWGIQEYEQRKFEETYKGNKEDFETEFKKYLEEVIITRNFNDYKDVLEQETTELRKNCPTLALVYEMQDELIYNQIIIPQKTEILGNDEEINKTIIGEEFDKCEALYKTLSPEEKVEFEKTYSEFKQYMYEFNEEGKTTEEIEKMKAKAYAIYKVQQLTNDDIDRIRESRDLSDAIEEISDEISLEELTAEEKESFKRRVLESRKDGKETVEVATKTGNGELSPLGQTSDTRVAVFGKDSWKAIIGTRKLDDLKTIYNEVKEQSREGKEDKAQENDYEGR